MKKLSVLLTLILAAGLAYAQETKKTEPTKPVAVAKPAEAAKPVAKTHDVAAEVVSVDTLAKTITIKGEKANLTVPFDEKVLASVKDFKAGQKTTLVCQDDAKGNHKIVGVKTEAPKPAPKPETK